MCDFLKIREKEKVILVLLLIDELDSKYEELGKLIEQDHQFNPCVVV